ncbi:MAG: polyprenyl synthetase family protein [Verrucomicrobiota bacterium]
MLANSFIAIHNNSTVDIKVYWKRKQKLVDQALNRELPPKDKKPSTIHTAMRYSIFAGGKRLRPIICLASAEALGGDVQNALPLACAVECIHTYSLIHDDLPCMDDDDLRRGMPTSHKKFGEGIAVLTGDALLTEAFAIASRCKGWKNYSTAKIIQEIAQASGSQALIAGQVVDLECEGKKITPTQLRYIHNNKTAALISASIRLGAMSANASPSRLKLMTEFGQALGLAFQIIDDILDITQTSAELGKSAGKDLTSEKATYPSILGMAKAQKEAKRLTDLAFNKVRSLGKKAEALQAISAYLLERKS